MKKVLSGFMLTLLLLAPALAMAADSHGKPANDNLKIWRDSTTGQIVVSWSGKGVLKQATGPNGKFRPVPKRGNQSYHIADSSEQAAVYRLESADGGASSLNLVGYVNLSLPPGLSLIANPLFSQNHSNQVAYWWPTAPDGSQILKYVSGVGYEVSTFDGIEQAWSNPILEVPLGDGFYFRNPSSTTVTHTFVGEVIVGYSTNTLPAGISMQGAMLPMAGSINSVQLIPGEAGDELRTYTNDLLGGGTENISTFNATLNQWVPDLTLHVGEGFWISKQQQQDWVRYFDPFN